MPSFGTSEQDIAEKLFTFCVQGDASFQDQFIESMQAAGIHFEFPPDGINHPELIIYYVWMVRRVIPERPKIMSPLHSAHYVASLRTYFDQMNDEQILQMVEQRFEEYDKSMVKAPQNLDLIYTAPYVTQRIFNDPPLLQDHFPKIEIIVTRIFTVWVASVAKAMSQMFA